VIEFMFRTKHAIATISRLNSLQWLGLLLANAKLNYFDRNLNEIFSGFQIIRYSVIEFNE